jgi:hypothetical protein
MHRGRGIAMDEKAPLLEYEMFTVRKAKFVDVDDSSRKHGR